MELKLNRNFVIFLRLFPVLSQLSKKAYVGYVEPMLSLIDVHRENIYEYLRHFVSPNILENPTSNSQKAIPFKNSQK